VSDLVLRGGALVLEDRVEIADLVVRGGRIAAVGGRVAAAAGAEVIDCSGTHVFPGLVDLHVHLDDHIGPFALADTWETGSRVALATGVTTLAAFATQSPNGAESVVDAVDAVLARAEGRSHCDYTVHYTPTRWDEDAWRALEPLAARGMKSVKLYTTYGHAGLHAPAAVVERVLSRAADLGLTVLLHCEDDETLRAAAADPALDWSDARTHTAARPPAAEHEAVARAVELCRTTGGRLHVVHVTTPAAVRLIRAAAADLPLSCETCPQYLALDASRLAGPDGYRYVCSPPLRDAEAREALLGLARQGSFDVIATDHCAFSRADKAVGAGRDVRQTPNGLAGLGALAPLSRELLIGDPADRAALTGFARMLSSSPARLLGLYPRKGALRVGADADIVVARLDAEPAPIRSTLADAHEPYGGWTSRWRAERVYLRGELAARGGGIVGAGPRGEPAWRR
jgi:dihydropyrimidinase